MMQAFQKHMMLAVIPGIGIPITNGVCSYAWSLM